MTSTLRYEALRRELDPKVLMQEARVIAGLSDYGDEGFVEPLNKFMDCIAHDVNFHAAGLKEFREEYIGHLVNRLRFQDDLKRHPEILDEDVSDPIILIGLPRSGTTKSHRMLGADPNLLKTFMWQLQNPAPFPNAVPGQPDPRIAAASHDDSLFAAENEALHAAHLWAVEQVEEDWFLFELTFNDWSNTGRTLSRSWSDWVMSRTAPPDIENYRYVRSLIQYLQWQQGGRRNRRWLMKGNGHPAHMEELISTYPKATIVHIHRHPAACIPSLAETLLEIGSLRIDNLDPKMVGALVFDWEKWCIDRYLETRDHLNLDDRIFDVQYDQIRSDPMPVFRDVYRRARHMLTAEAEQAMLQWEKDNEQGKHGAHVYSLEQFGLSKQKIDDAFSEYVRRFIKR